MKISVDTNFLISSTQWDYSVSHKLLIRLIKEDIEIFTTKDILTEFSEVLARDFRYNQDEINNIIEKTLAFVKIVEPKEKIEIVKNDPEDNKIIECAIESSSNYIITYDKHLLNIKEYKGIKIIKPEEVFDILEQD